MDMFITLTSVLDSQVPTDIKTYYSLHFKYVQGIACQPYLNEVFDVYLHIPNSLMHFNQVKDFHDYVHTVLADSHYVLINLSILHIIKIETNICNGSYLNI